MESIRWKVGVYATFVAFSLWSVYLYVYDSSLLAWITHEDSVSESLSAVCYLVAAAIFFIEWARHGFRNIFVLGYALLFLFVGGEEISWGQRIIGLRTPEALMEINVQREANLHNIDGIHQHVRMVGLLVVITIAVLMPVAQRWIPFLRELFDRLMIPVVALWTVPLTILAMLFMVIPRVFLNKTVFMLDEVGELYLSVVFLLFAIAARTEAAKSRRGSGGASEGAST